MAVRNLRVIFFILLENICGLCPPPSNAYPSIKFVNLLPDIQLSMLKYYSRSPIYLIFFFSIQQVTWTAQVFFDALSGHFPFEKKFEKRIHFLLVFSGLFSRTLCICVFRSRTIVNFVIFFFHQFVI
jgi:hypothetical protein